MNHSIFILYTSFHSLSLFGYGPSFLQFGPYLSLLLVYGSTSVPATSFHCFCHVTTRLVLARPFWAYHALFFYSIHVAQYFCWVNSHTILGFLGPFHFLWASSARFISLGILGPFHSYILMGFYYILWASLA